MTLKRSFSILICILFSSVLAFGQVDKARIKSQAEESVHALLKKDYATLTKYTYPKVVELLGGEEKMIALVKKGQVDLESQGIAFDTAMIGNPSDTVKAGNEIHCLVPQTVVLKLSKGKVTSESYLIGISKDGGQRWYFIDTAQVTMENVKSILPNYNTKLVIPAKVPPVFTEQ